MLSRVAESIYWMSRYVERAENVARFISVNLNLSLDMPGEAGQQWWPLVIITGDDAAYQKRISTTTKESVVQFLTFDTENPNSILSCLLRRPRERPRRGEIISAEMWEHINKFYLAIRDGGSLEEVLDNPYTFFERVSVSGQQFLGVTDATMTHGEAWHFCQMGRMLERADKTSRILDVKYFILLPKLSDVGTPFDDIQWLALLRSASALEMYRQRHGRISPVNVVNFLVLDREFPRAVLHCLTRANESLHAISGTHTGGYTNIAERRLGQLRAELAYTHAEDVIRDGLHEFVDSLQNRVNTIGESISDSFFAMRPLETAGAGR